MMDGLGHDDLTPSAEEALRAHLYNEGVRIRSESRRLKERRGESGPVEVRDLSAALPSDHISGSQIFKPEATEDEKFTRYIWGIGRLYALAGFVFLYVGAHKLRIADDFLPHSPSEMSGEQLLFVGGLLCAIGWACEFVLSGTIARYRAKRARMKQVHNQIEAKIRLVDHWSDLEDTLRFRASAYLPYEQFGIVDMTAVLLREGIIDRVDVDTIQQTLTIRNRLVHDTAAEMSDELIRNAEDSLASLEGKLGAAHA